MRLSGKVAIVTGAGGGIGAAIARRFAAEGAAVVVAGRTSDRLDEVTEGIQKAGGKALAVPTDVRVAEQVAAMATRTVETFGGLDILVNNAGITTFGVPVDDPSPSTVARFDDVIATNLRGAWLAIHYSVPHMKARQGGAIIQIGSVHGTLGAPENSAYAASKGALDAMTRSLAVELAPFNIRVNNCNPGAILTHCPDLVDRLADLGETECAQRLLEAYTEYRRCIQPLRRVGEPDDVAEACVYLASDAAKYVTGTTLMVDGGSTAVLGEPGRLPEDAFRVVAAYRAVQAEMEAFVAAREGA